MRVFHFDDEVRIEHDGEIAVITQKQAVIPLSWACEVSSGKWVTFDSPIEVATNRLAEEIDWRKSWDSQSKCVSGIPNDRLFVHILTCGDEMAVLVSAELDDPSEYRLLRR